MTTIPYTARDFDEIKTALAEFIGETRPDVWSDFFESNLGVALIEMIAYVGDILSYGMDIVGTEVFLATLRRYDSALRFARSVGYVPRSAVPAEVTVTSVDLPSQVGVSGAKVLAGAFIEGLNGLRYELLEDVVINATDTVSRLPLWEGESFEEVSAPTSLQFQEIVSENGVVAADSWDVFVGDPDDPTNEWEEVDNIRFETSPTKTYETYFDGEGRLHVVFGDGTSGQIPDQDVTLKYRTTNGDAGNSPSNSIQGTVQAQLLSGGGDVIAIEYKNSEGPASGGQDRESVDEMKVNIPAYIRSSDKLITLSDYNTNLTRVSGVALAFADRMVASYSGNVVQVHVWGDESVDFVSDSPLSGRSSTAEYRRYTQLAFDRQDDVQAFMNPRTIVTVHNIIERPTVAWVDLYLSNVTYDNRFNIEDVHQAVTDAVVAVFEASTGFVIRIADLYNAIDDALGIKHYYIERAILEALERIQATGTITLSGDVDVNETVTIGDGDTDKTFEFLNSPADPPTDPSYIPVVRVPGNVVQTIKNLQNRIIANLNMDALYDEDAPNPQLDLTSGAYGVIGNIPITVVSTSGNMTATGMSGGSDDPVLHIFDYRRDMTPEAEDLWPPAAYAPGGEWSDGNIGFYQGVDPVDGDTVSIQDGLGGSVTFEFDDDASAVGTPVTIVPGDQEATLDNFAAAIIASVLDIAPEVIASAVPSLRMEVADGGVITLATSEPTRILVSDGWLSGGQPEYEPIQDIRIKSVQGEVRYYDYTYRYNNEIRYNSGVSAKYAAIQALNLRRLSFDLLTETEAS